MISSSPVWWPAAWRLPYPWTACRVTSLCSFRSSNWHRTTSGGCAFLLSLLAIKSVSTVYKFHRSINLKSILCDQAKKKKGDSKLVSELSLRRTHRKSNENLSSLLFFPLRSDRWLSWCCGLKRACIATCSDTSPRWRRRSWRAWPGQETHRCGKNSEPTRALCPPANRLAIKHTNSPRSRAQVSFKVTSGGGFWVMWN